MPEEKVDVQESENTEEEKTSKNDEQEEKDFKQLYENQKIRAEKAEKELKKLKPSSEDDPSKKVEEPKKLNEQAGLSRDEAILISKGHTVEEVDLALKIAKLNGIPVSEAIKDDYFKSTVKARKDKERSEKAELPAAQGPISTPKKDPGEMSREEHQDWYLKEIDKAARG